METEHRADLKGKAQRPCGQAGDQHVPLPWAGRSGAAVLSFATRNHPPGSEANGQPGPGSGRLVTWVCCLRDSPWVGSAGSPPPSARPFVPARAFPEPRGGPTLCLRGTAATTSARWPRRVSGPGPGLDGTRAPHRPGVWGPPPGVCVVRATCGCSSLTWLLCVQIHKGCTAGCPQDCDKAPCAVCVQVPTWAPVHT